MAAVVNSDEQERVESGELRVVSEDDGVETTRAPGGARGS
jgi:hypothetical protein